MQPRQALAERDGAETAAQGGPVGLRFATRWHHDKLVRQDVITYSTSISACVKALALGSLGGLVVRHRRRGGTPPCSSCRRLGRCLWMLWCRSVVCVMGLGRPGMRQVSAPATLGLR